MKKNFGTRVSIYLIAATALTIVHLKSFSDMKKYKYHLLQEKEAKLLALSNNRQLSLQNSLRFNLNYQIQNTFDQKLDHTNPNNTQTFKQRYFINSRFAEGANSPVFYELCGESRCDGIAFGSSVMQYAKKYKAHIVRLEHRYYGDSQPFVELTTENLKYLNTENALADLAYFQDFITAQNHWTGPWIAIGGSYAGSLAAYYRLIYPEKVIGALASSAPVEAKADFEEYDANIATVASGLCLNTIRTAVKRVEDMLDNQKELENLKHLFRSDDIKHNVSFLFVLADMVAGAVQYGRKNEFCSTLLSSPDLLKGYAKAGLAINDWLGMTPIETSYEGAKSLHASDYTGNGTRQWAWQTCTEYGYYQIAHSNPERSARSSRIDLNYNNEMCFELFGLQNQVDTEKINRMYYKPLLDANRNPQASRIFFTNGSTDPWQFLSISHERGNDTNPLFSYMTLEGASHCNDLGISLSPSVRQAQNEFNNLLNQWL